MSTIIRLKKKTDNTCCCVPQCSSKGTSFPYVSFHTFPPAKREPIRRKRWILALRIGKPVTPRMKVCSKHFVEKDYLRPITPTMRPRLHPSAVPTQNLPKSKPTPSNSSCTSSDDEESEAIQDKKYEIIHVRAASPERLPSSNVIEDQIALKHPILNQPVQKFKHYDKFQIKMLKMRPLSMKIMTHDMHTAGEPLRIIVSGYPELKGETLLEKREYAKNHLDDYREFLMSEPRGHKDMYGAIVLQDKPFDKNIGVIFIHNEGYSTMCGHGVIALGRYVIDKDLVVPTSPVTEVNFICPCGPVKTRIEYNNGLSGRVTFQSVPAFVFKFGLDINIPELGPIKVDIAFGGAFYVIVTDKDIGLDLSLSSLTDIVDYASIITENVKRQVPIIHPQEEELSFLYGTIITDGNDELHQSTNICVFADKQVDRSPTGSGVSARIALQFAKGMTRLNHSKEFFSLIGTSFIGKAVKEIAYKQYCAVIVEVTGMAYHTGTQTFYLEKGDPIGLGFQLDR